jgi:hypothetical protein
MFPSNAFTKNLKIIFSGFYDTSIVSLQLVKLTVKKVDFLNNHPFNNQATSIFHCNFHTYAGNKLIISSSQNQSFI